MCGIEDMTKREGTHNSTVQRSGIFWDTLPLLGMYVHSREPRMLLMDLQMRFRERRGSRRTWLKNYPRFVPFLNSESSTIYSYIIQSDVKVFSG